MIFCKRCNTKYYYYCIIMITVSVAKYNYYYIFYLERVIIKITPQYYYVCILEKFSLQKNERYEHFLIQKPELLFCTAKSMALEKIVLRVDRCSFSSSLHLRYFPNGLFWFTHVFLCLTAINCNHFNVHIYSRPFF